MELIACMWPGSGSWTLLCSATELLASHIFTSHPMDLAILPAACRLCRVSVCLTGHHAGFQFV